MENNTIIALVVGSVIFIIVVVLIIIIIMNRTSNPGLGDKCGGEHGFCENNLVCFVGRSGIEGVCYEGIGKPCTHTSECIPGVTCSDGICKGTSCTSDADCSTGMFCFTGTCVKE